DRWIVWPCCTTSTAAPSRSSSCTRRFIAASRSANVVGPGAGSAEQAASTETATSTTTTTGRDAGGMARPPRDGARPTERWCRRCTATGEVAVSLPNTAAQEGDPMELLRTPDDRFEGLPGYDFAPHYVEVPSDDRSDAPIRIHYLDEGPSDGEIVLL